MSGPSTPPKPAPPTPTWQGPYVRNLVGQIYQSALDVEWGLRQVALVAGQRGANDYWVEAARRLVRHAESLATELKLDRTSYPPSSMRRFRG